MSIITELVNQARASHEDQPVSEILIGLHWTMVTSRHTGLAATNGDAPCCYSQDIENVGHLQNRSVFELIELLYSSHPLEVSVGMAALNSIIDYDPATTVEYNARDLLLEKGNHKNVAIIGHFPFGELLREKATNLWVLELNPAPGEFDASEAENLLPRADVIGLTATTLMNGTFENLSRLFPSNALIVMMGPSTPMSSVIFNYGVEILAGSKVTDSGALSRFIGQGSTLHKVDGLKRITIARNLNEISA
ncbi:MAG TPA: DUF364 domain-containing protein [Leptolinea sp.]